MIAAPASASLRSSWYISCLVPTSMPRVGSLRRRIRGAIISHLPITSFCWLPPESELAIRSDGTEPAAGSLSGGNQQKLVIGKWLMTAPRIILLNDPTRGIDVGTKQEIYQLLRRLAEQGAAILFYSTDYDELIGCCDRVLVMYDGAIKRELVGAEITEHALISSALNIGASVASNNAHSRP